MKTIQEHLRTCDRGSVIGIFIDQHILSNTAVLLSNKDRTVREIIENSKKRLNDLIDRLIAIEPKDTGERDILMVAHSSQDDIRIMLLSEKDILEGRRIPYCYSYLSFAETLGFLVADTYLTQYYLNELIAEYLFEVTWTGYDQEYLEDEIRDIAEAVEESGDTEKCFTEEEFRKNLEESFGFEFEARDPKEEEAWRKLIRSEAKYDSECLKIEIEKIKGDL